MTPGRSWKINTLVTQEALNGHINTLGQGSSGLTNGILHPAGKYVSHVQKKCAPLQNERVLTTGLAAMCRPCIDEDPRSLQLHPLRASAETKHFPGASGLSGRGRGRMAFPTGAGSNPAFGPAGSRLGRGYQDSKKKRRTALILT